MHNRSIITVSPFFRFELLFAFYLKHVTKEVVALMLNNCVIIPLGDPVTDLSSKCFVDLDKHQETLCIKKEWASTCPHTCRGTFISTDYRFWLILQITSENKPRPTNENKNKPSKSQTQKFFHWQARKTPKEVTRALKKKRKTLACACGFCFILLFFVLSLLPCVLLRAL